MTPNKILCKKCGRELVHTKTVEKNDQYYHFYYCTPCERPTHRITYVYTPLTCPKHRWEFMGTEFQDRGSAHEIWHVNRCFRCGDVMKIPRHTTAAGVSGRVEIDHPLVANTLFLNRSVMKVLGNNDQKHVLPPEELPDRITLPEEVHI